MYRSIKSWPPWPLNAPLRRCATSTTCLKHFPQPHDAESELVSGSDGVCPRPFRDHSDPSGTPLPMRRRLCLGDAGTDRVKNNTGIRTPGTLRQTDWRHTMGVESGRGLHGAFLTGHPLCSLTRNACQPRDSRWPGRNCQRQLSKAPLHFRAADRVTQHGLRYCKAGTATPSLSLSVVSGRFARRWQAIIGRSTARMAESELQHSENSCPPRRSAENQQPPIAFQSDTSAMPSFSNLLLEAALPFLALRSARDLAPTCCSAVVEFWPVALTTAED
jgi:hypothetical protein